MITVKIFKKVKETMEVTKTKTISVVIAVANQIINELDFVKIINQNAAKWDKIINRIIP